MKTVCKPIGNKSHCYYTQASFWTSYKFTDKSVPNQRHHHIKNLTQKGRGIAVCVVEYVEEVANKAGEEKRPLINGGAPTVKKLR